ERGARGRGLGASQLARHEHRRRYGRRIRDRHGDPVPDAADEHRERGSRDHHADAWWWCRRPGRPLLMRAIWLLLLTACSLNVDYTGTNYQCNPDGTCPSGYECLDMVCVPTDPVPPACAEEVSAGGSHSCAIRNDGTGWCWGRNDFRQLGDGTANDSDAPVEGNSAWGVVKVAAA